MNIKIRDRFIKLWRKYFHNAELPITFYYSDKKERAELVKPGSVDRCVIGALAEVRKGRSFSFNADSVGCFGGRRYLGFAEELMPDFEYFLSCGIPGKLEGERYKKSPELVEEIMRNWPRLALRKGRNWSSFGLRLPKRTAGWASSTMHWRQGSSKVGSLPREYRLSSRRRRNCSRSRLMRRRHCDTKLWTWPIPR